MESQTWLPYPTMGERDGHGPELHGGGLPVVPLCLSQNWWGAEHLQVFVLKSSMTERSVTRH